jgi:hypothetical protein
MARPDLTAPLTRMVRTIANKNTYYGSRISPSIIALISIEIRPNGGGVVAPYWLGVTERGRGVRKSTTDSGLASKIYLWMERRKMFKSKTPAGRVAEARSMTWYINKYGNKQFRTKTFIDIYTQAREQCIREVMTEYGLVINKITMDIL